MNVSAELTLDQKQVLTILPKLLAMPRQRESACVLLLGPPGSSKTSLVRLVAKLTGHDLVVTQPGLLEVSDVMGYPAIAGDGKMYFYPRHLMARLYDAKKPTIWFLDDFGQAREDVQKAHMPLLLDGEMEGRRLPSCVKIVAASNRREDKSGVTTILEAVKSRFATILTLRVALQPWMDWAVENGIHVHVRQFCRYIPAHITGGPDGWKPGVGFEQAACPRTVANADRLYRLDLPEDIKHAAIAGAAGPAFAQGLYQFVNYFMDLPDVDKILRNPTKAPIPQNISALWALTGAIVEAAGGSKDPAKLNGATLYAGHLQNNSHLELAVAMMRDLAVKAKNALTVLPAYIKWLTDKDVSAAMCSL